MGAIISSNTLRLEPDAISYQTARVKLPDAPVGANTMIFYYKAYFENCVVNTGGGEFTESSSSYAWNKDAMFGLSFTGIVSAKGGGFLGFSNATNNTNICRVRQPGEYSPWASNSGFSTGAIPVGFNQNSEFFYGPGRSTFNVDYHSSSTGSYTAGVVAPSIYHIGLDGASKYLGIIKVSKNENNSQNIVMSLGNNWQNLQSSSFSTALTSLSTNWAFQNIDKAETVYFRSNYLNPSLSGTINFPSWVVIKWPSGVLGRTFVVTDIKIEYYS